MARTRVRSGRTRRFSPVQALVLAISLVTASFIAAVIYEQVLAHSVQEDIQGILTNSVPSVRALTAASRALRHLDGAMDWALVAMIERRPVDTAAIDKNRLSLEAELEVYTQLPFYPEERQGYGELIEALRRLDDVRDRLIAIFATADRQRAAELENGEWRTASDDVGVRLQSLILLNAAHAANHGRRIERIRKRSVNLGLVFAALTLLLAIASTVIAAQVIQRMFRYEEQRSTELQAFADRIAHDLRSPLAALKLRVSLLPKIVDLEPKAQESITRMAWQIATMGSLVDGLLQFARAGAKPRPGERADVGRLIALLLPDLQLSAQSVGAEIRVEAIPPVAVACSEGALVSVLSNLAQNAIKFIGEGTSSARRIVIRVKGEDELVRFEVEDTGPGLPRGSEQNLFEPYVRSLDTKQPGLGLGLATVKRLVEAYGGRVGVEALPGQGSCFWFELAKAGS